MRAPYFLTRTRYGLLLLALLCILLARTAVPAGWMPAMAADGGVVLAPCSGMGVATLPAAHAMPGMEMAADMPGMATHDAGDTSERHPDSAGDHPCSGAGIAVALAAPAAILPGAWGMAPRAAPVAQLIPTIGRGLAAPPPPSTGPPAFA